MDLQGELGLFTKMQTEYFYYPGHTVEGYEYYMTIFRRASSEVIFEMSVEEQPEYIDDEGVSKPRVRFYCSPSDFIDEDGDLIVEAQTAEFMVYESLDGGEPYPVEGRGLISINRGLE